MPGLNFTTTPCTVTDLPASVVRFAHTSAMVLPPAGRAIGAIADACVCGVPCTSAGGCGAAVPSLAAAAGALACDAAGCTGAMEEYGGGRCRGGAGRPRTTQEGGGR